MTLGNLEFLSSCGGHYTGGVKNLWDLLLTKVFRALVSHLYRKMMLPLVTSYTILAGKSGIY